MSDSHIFLFRTALHLALAALLLWPAASARAQEQRASQRGSFEFAAIGDQQYGAASEAQFPRLLQALSRAKLAFVAHVGDIKDGASPCTDELLRSRLAEFNSAALPFLYTPGDNEWTDCTSTGNASYPLDRLSKLRELFFPPGESLGRRRIRVARQSSEPDYKDYVENSYWIHNGVMFAMLHVVGSNNNRRRLPTPPSTGPPADPSAENAEYRARTAANIAWAVKVFERARQLGLTAVVIITQANTQFENIDQAEAPERPSGFRETLRALRDLTLRWGKPVLLIHGDTHNFRIDKPLLDTQKRVIESFTRLEVFGYPYAHWVRVRVSPRDPNPFTFTPEIVPANATPR